MDLSFNELLNFVRNQKEADFRALQVWKWLWQKGQFDFSLMTDLKKSFRKSLEQDWDITLPTIHGVKKSDDRTIKLILKLYDGSLIETVLIHEKGRYTQCLSTQVGCSMGCTFCSTGKMGFIRNMTASEICSQVLMGSEYLKENGNYTIKNLVLMGMGEPLLNWHYVKKSLDILTSPQGACFTRRRITLSTVGIPGMLEKFANTDMALPAISLHAPNQKLRKIIMPKAARFNLSDLMREIDSYPLRKRERITIEYLLLGDINDSPSHARELTFLLKGLRCKINLIAYNPGSGLPYYPPKEESIENF